jgi:hypothetical protein
MLGQRPLGFDAKVDPQIDGLETNPKKTLINVAVGS